LKKVGKLFGLWRAFALQKNKQTGRLKIDCKRFFFQIKRRGELQAKTKTVLAPFVSQTTSQNSCFVQNNTDGLEAFKAMQTSPTHGSRLT